jgi:hypothetical protein
VVSGAVGSPGDLGGDLDHRLRHELEILRVEGHLRAGGEVRKGIFVT